MAKMVCAACGRGLAECTRLAGIVARSFCHRCAHPAYARAADAWGALA